MAQTVKNLPAMQETWVQVLSWDDPLEKGMAPHSSILAWRIPFCLGYTHLFDSLVAQTVKNLPAVQETWVRSLSWEDPLEKGMAIPSSILACLEPGGLQSMVSQTVRHD